MLEVIKMNCKNLLLNQKKFLFLLFVAQIFSVMVILLSYGIINHYDAKIGIAESTSLKFIFSLDEEFEARGEFLNYKEVEKFFSTVLPVMENKLDYFYVDAKCDGYHAMSTNGYKDGRIILSTQMKKKVTLAEGEKFSEKDMSEGRHCVIVGQNLANDSGYMTIGEEHYEIIGIIGIRGLENDFFIPFGAMPKNSQIDYTSIFFTQPLLETEYNVLVKVAKECYGEKIVIPEFDGIKNESGYKVYRGMVLATVILMLLCAINYSIIYRYVLEKRRRIFVVSRICGCKKNMLSIAYMLEMLVISIATLIIGIVLFHNIVLPRSTGYFEYIEMYCTFDAYKGIAVIYIIILLMVYSVLIGKFVKNTPVSLMKGV